MNPDPFGPENENESFGRNGNNAALQVSSLKGLQETSLPYACFLNHARVSAVLYKIQHFTDAEFCLLSPRRQLVLSLRTSDHKFLRGGIEMCICGFLPSTSP